MRLTIHTTDRGTVSLGSMPDENILELVDDFQANPKDIFTITLNTDAVTHINGRHIVRIDIDPDDQPGGDQ